MLIQEELTAAFHPGMQACASTVTQYLWLIPAMPMVASGIIALLRQPRRKPAAALAIGSLGLSLLVALAAFAHVVSDWTQHIAVRETVNLTWMQVGASHVELGWVLDPLSAAMMVMVCFVGLLIFIYSVGYMEHDENFTRFFCFLALFAGAMLGVVIANSLLLLFMCWELVGLTSYLLIGFWYHKPSAAAAAKKAFLTTRVGDIFFLLGMVWLFAQTGTLLFYNSGAGSMEPLALGGLLATPSALGLTAAGAIGLLIFAGAAGKSGQLPLHVWLPDAMEGPTPVSALIHAATMVAAGVYLVARVYPLMSAGIVPGGSTTALTVVTWVGASTAVFAALIAVAQNDIKRILAYSTVSQLGYMMAGLGMGGVAVGMFHLITHAFFKALLFMGAGSVIHGCHDEQDVRKMGGLRGEMPVTFLTYAVGMLALCGFPLVFSGFWSKDAILESAKHWSVASGPFYMLVFGALLTAFYMTRQVSYVFFGKWRGHGHAHESPAVMTMPLAILAFFAMALGFIGTPAWPWFRAFLENRTAEVSMAGFAEPGLMQLMLTSSLVVFAGLGLGWWLYGSKSPAAEEPDALERMVPPVWVALHDRLYVDELYGVTVIAFYGWWARVADWLDRFVWGGVVAAV
ncbi:MAG: NADH-quinone oxidoreductase subunit L, partial [Terracidiphilus sp.]